jgi:hypothetical protein
MIIKLKYKDKEETVELQSCVSVEDIQALFPIKFSSEFNDNCSYEVLEGEDPVTLKEILAYTE